MGEHGFGLQFCNKCGSTLCGIYQNEIHGVTLGCVNEDPELEIGRHIFVGSKASWEVIPEGVPQYEEQTKMSNLATCLRHFAGLTPTWLAVYIGVRFSRKVCVYF